VGLAGAPACMTLAFPTRTWGFRLSFHGGQAAATLDNGHFPGATLTKNTATHVPTTSTSNTTMADSFSYEQLIASGEGRLFSPDSGRLPLPPMLMFDRITHIDSDGGAHGLGKIVAELDVKPGLWFFECHFQGDPVMPGCLGLDAMWQLIGFYLTWLRLPGRGRALGAGEVKIPGEVGPDVKLVTYEIDIKRVIKRKLNMAIGDARLLADGKEIYVANDLRVGLFLREEKEGQEAAAV